MYRIGNKILKLGGKILKAENQTIIELTVRGTSFPDRTTGTAFEISSSAGNRMYIDYDDGTGIHQYMPNVLSNFNYLNTIIKYYQDLADPTKIGTIDPNYSQERKIRIWFDFPQRVSTINFQNFNIYSSFPSRIGNYSLSQIRFSGTNFLTSFPINFRGGVFVNLIFFNISQTKITLFPSWIGNSKITNLFLNNIFNLSAGNVATGVDSVSNVQGLVHLRLTNANMTQNSHFPATLKNITTLRTLGIGDNNFTAFPGRVGECSQIETLTISSNDSYGINSAMTSWGAGIGLMVNLKSLIFMFTGSGNMTTSLPIGIENCVLLKNINASVTYITSIALDAFVSNFYDFVTANASLTPGDTKFRNMIINIGTAFNIQPIRPSGGATPTSVVYPAITPMQKIYNLCKDYGHTWTVRNIANTGIETITPIS